MNPGTEVIFDEILKLNNDIYPFETKILTFDHQRLGSVKKYLNILTDCKDNKQILDLYYLDLYKYISIIQISVIVLSSISTFFQALPDGISIPNDFILIFTLCVSTYISLVLSILKFFKFDELKEHVNTLSNKYADIHNEIRYILDLLKPWKEPWYLEPLQIEEKLLEWNEFRKELNLTYVNIIKNKQTLYTEYEKIFNNKKKIENYKKKLDIFIIKDIEDNQVDYKRVEHIPIIDNSHDTHDTNIDTNQTKPSAIIVI